jgi:hypothetical protein
MISGVREMSMSEQSRGVNGLFSRLSKETIAESEKSLNLD